MCNTNVRFEFNKRKQEFKEKFKIEIYEQYANGRLKYCDMLRVFNTDPLVLDTYLEEHNLPKRRHILKNTTKEDFFDIIDCEAKAYLLGFFLADGNIRGNRISVRVSESDLEIVEIFKNEIAPKVNLHKINARKNKDGSYTKPMIMFHLSSKHLADTLRTYGFGERKTYNDKIDLSFIPKKFIIHFLRGYFDGDGCCYSGEVKRNFKNKIYKFRNYNMSITSFTRKHLDYLNDYLNNEMTIKSRVLQEKRGYFLLQVTSKKDFFKFREVLYKDSNYFLKRKKEKFFSYEKGEPDRIIKQFRNGELIGCYKNAKEAGRANNVTGACILQRIKKKLNINGDTWIYAYEDI